MISSSDSWHILKASVTSNPTTFYVTILDAHGTVLTDHNSLAISPVVSTPTMTTFLISSSLSGSGGKICLTFLGVYPFPFPNDIIA